jgi:transcriptional regulator with XRE-family HTH domain
MTQAAHPAISQSRTLGDHLREWRKRRRMSQLDLALEAEVSQKHVSFVESGRSMPSRDMVLHLAERLDVPKREQNILLLAAGYAPVHPEHSLDDSGMTAVRMAIDRILKGHEPYPALAVDRHWTMVASNAAVAALVRDVADPALLAPPVNVLRLSLHPQGLAPRIENLGEWRAHLIERLGRQIAVTGDPVLVDLLHELSAYPVPARALGRERSYGEGSILVPLRLATAAGPLDLISTTTVFGTPRDVTLSELALEAFFPATTESAERLARLTAEQ